MKLSIGTSGFGYKEWRGSFYPEKLPAARMLSFYGERLPAVEINNSFYRLPRSAVLEGWAAQVPEDFRFSLKASRRITHFKRLRDAAEPTDYLLRTAGVLGERLGAVLFQLPPDLSLDLPRLDAFLACLPEGRRAAFEFRHESWLDDAVLERLRARDLAWVVSDGDEDEAGSELVTTASWGYLRLRRSGYDRDALAAWAQRIRATGWEQVFAFFKHEEAGAGPRLAAEFLELAERAAARRPPLPARAPARRRRAG